MLREVRADYTDEARRRGVTGDVVLEIVVRRDGGVGDIKVLQGLAAGLNERAVQARPAVALLSRPAPGHACGRHRRGRRGIQVEVDAMNLYLAVTAASLIVAAIMSGLAWRVARGERRRSEARVRALAADIAAEEGSGHSRPLFNHEDRAVPDLEPRPPVAIGQLFEAAGRPAAGRAPAAIALGMLAAAGAAALAVVLSAGSRTAPAPSAASARVTAPAESQLELLALGHDRTGDRLTVRGVVRNPRGPAVDHLAAVVVVFNRDGALVSSARGAVDVAVLAPGAESTFGLSVPGADDIARYRVSFRTDERVVSHVDRRTDTRD